MNNKFDYSVLGIKIRQARKAKNMTQEQLAEACDLSTAHIGHIERGTRALSIESLILISRVLNISTDYLLFDVANLGDKRIDNLLGLVKNADKEKVDRFYVVVKILAENIDKI